MENTKFDKFLTDSTSQKEISLVLVENSEDFADLKDSLVKNGYNFSSDIISKLNNLNNDDKICFVINNETDAKLLYDFALQYPTGQINLFDDKVMETINISPSYDNKSLLLLLTDNQLENLKNINFDFLSVSGMTYRNKD